jgi:hypothetical protein
MPDAPEDGISRKSCQIARGTALAERPFMLRRTSSLAVLLSSMVLALGCSSSDDGPPVNTDSAIPDSSGDTPSGNTCTPAGGTCIALTATGKCPDGSATPTSSAIHCEGAGSQCCVPTATDGGSDADSSSDATTVCESHGGKCIAVTPTSKCPDGYASSTDACGGVGATCCTPVDSDGGSDADTHD